MSAPVKAARSTAKLLISAIQVPSERGMAAAMRNSSAVGVRQPEAGVVSTDILSNVTGEKRSDLFRYIDDSRKIGCLIQAMKTENTRKATKSDVAVSLPEDPTAVDTHDRPVTFRIREYAAPHKVAMHRHRRAQLLYSSRGVMQVSTAHGIWVVPSNRAVWLPPETDHEVVSHGPLSLRNLYFEPRYCVHLPRECGVVTVSPLLRELILHAVQLSPDYDEAGPDGRLMQVILDQIQALPIAPLHLPLSDEPRLRAIMSALQADPANSRSLEEWGVRVGASARTLGRLFLAQTGFTFGQWRQQVRLLAALEGLAQGRSVTAVAADLGYEKQSAFITMFKRALGKTPGRFFR